MTDPNALRAAAYGVRGLRDTTQGDPSGYYAPSCSIRMATT
jgi:hypothetical protein